MNLMKLFNVNYLMQNFKKSKVILSIFVALIPILNTIILIMSFGNSNNVFGFSEISVINFIGVYILPVIISICLFNYVYKKKSVDFINSMPISRKSIFVTNTIFGLLIFLSMLLVNILLMLILTFVFSIPIPFVMMFDYLWYWFIVYVFTFSATNVAMTISGNAITQIVVTLLLVFLVPFTHAFTNVLADYNSSSVTYLQCDNDKCVQEDYYCYDDLECNINKNANIYRIDLNKIENNNYTSLFGFLYGGIVGDSSLINTISIIKMVILSICYIILGYILFIKRKMEVSETSFKNIHVHNIVKSLTLVPIIAFGYLICRYEDFISILFVLVIVLIYYFVYDLITKKSISNIKLSLIYFICSTCAIIIVYSGIEIANNKKELNTIKYSDIKEVAVDMSLYSSGYSNRDMNKLYIKNDLLKEIIVNNSFDYYNPDERNYYLKVYLKTKNNIEYTNHIELTKEDYNKIIDILSSNKEYVNYYKNIDFDNVYAVKVGDNLYSKKESKVVLSLVKDTLSNLSLDELFTLQGKYSDVSDDFYISLYTYKGHDSREFKVNGYINYDLLNSIVNSNNKELKNKIDLVIPENYTLYYSDSYMIEDYSIDYYILRNSKTEIYNFMLKEVNKTVDMKKEFITLQVNIDFNNYSFTTNNVDGFKEILDKKHEELKDTNEYKNYYGTDSSKYYIDKEESSYDY